MESVVIVSETEKQSLVVLLEFVFFFFVMLFDELILTRKVAVKIQLGILI